MLKIIEHIKTGAGWGKQDDLAGSSLAEASFNRVLH
jgi:hypothetical protein